MVIFSSLGLGEIKRRESGRLSEISFLLAAIGNLDGVRAALDDALEANPSSEVIQSLLGELSGKKELSDTGNSKPGE